MTTPDCWPASAGYRRGKARTFGKPLQVADIAHAPCGVFCTQAGIECRVVRRGVGAVAHEGAVDEKVPSGHKKAPGAGEQVLRHGPRRNMQHVEAEHGGELAAGSPGPIRVGEVDALRCAQVCQAAVAPPRIDAGEVPVVDVARPPHQRGRAACIDGRVLAGAAADFKHVAAAEPLQERPDRRPDRLVIAMEGGRVEPAVRRRRRGSALAKFDDKFCHDA